MQTQTERSPGVLNAGGILDRIVVEKTARLESQKKNVPFDLLSAEVSATKPRARTSFTAALKRSDRLNIIAEIKQRSPSKGVIRHDFDPVWIANRYSINGAAALSVLCEEDFFGGSITHLTEIRQQNGLPLLRKDFIFDRYQVLESSLAGADAILLIVAILGDELLRTLIEFSNELELDTLVEVHNEHEMKRALDAGSTIIGINNRDLTTFEVDLQVSHRLARSAPPGTLLVSESGITTLQDIERLREDGFNGFLIGEHLMRANDPGEALGRLISEAEVDRL